MKQVHFTTADDVTDVDINFNNLTWHVNLILINVVHIMSKINYYGNISVQFAAISICSKMINVRCKS